jgi:hypothetical protein
MIDSGAAEKAQFCEQKSEYCGVPGHDFCFNIHAVA